MLRTQPHPTFERRGDDLLANVTISLLDALVGLEREVGAAQTASCPILNCWPCCRRGRHGHCVHAAVILALQLCLAG